MPSFPPADFCFKQFSIWHQKCAMKVNTDGILLGAWSKVNTAKHILDIGTGTGLIALMLAQRTQTLTPQTRVTALEIDQDAYQQAQFNIKQSSWHSRMELIHHDFLTWQQEQKIPDGSFDIIVSNPPYFDNALLSQQQNKNLARHTAHMSFEQLLKAALPLLADNGEFNLILPLEQANKVIMLAEKIGLVLTRQQAVKTTPTKPVSRLLFCLQKSNLKTTKDVHNSPLVIRDESHAYSQEYISLCQEFYLKM